MQSETRPGQPAAVSFAGILLLAFVYLVLAWFCLKLASVHPSATPVWPPVGLAVGALIAFGRRYVLAVFLGTFLVSLIAVDFGKGAGSFAMRDVLLAGLIGLGNTVEALVGFMLVTRFADGRRCLDRVESVFGFVLFGALVPPLFSASFGVASLTLAGVLPATDCGMVFLTWYTGNVVGILTVAPLVIWFGGRRPAIEGGRVWESLAQLAVMFFVSQAVWGFVFPEFLKGLPQVYMAIPLVLWASMRLGRPVTLLSILLLSAVALVGTLEGREIFPGPSPNHLLIYFQIFIGIIAVMGLAVGALVDEIRATNEGLEEAVKERTVQLQRLVLEKDEFLSITVHELQSPLAGLRNLLELLRKNPGALAESGSGANSIVEEMEHATDTMLGRVKQLLDSQRLDDRIEELTPTDEDLGLLLEECVREQRPSAVAKDIAIDLKFPGEVIRAVTVRESVQNIFANLLSNAIKYTPPGRTVHLRLDRESDRARFEIQDEGPGIPPEQVSGLFGKFQHSTVEPTGGEPSVGLGLFIVGRMVDHLGGEIRCRCIDGEGACFIFYLPAKPAAP